MAKKSPFTNPKGDGIHGIGGQNKSRKVRKHQNASYDADKYAENRRTLNFDYLQNLSRKEQRQEAKLIHDAHSGERDKTYANQNISKSDVSVPTIMHNIKHHGTPFKITFATDRSTGKPINRANIQYGRMLTDKQIERKMRNRSTRGRGQLGS